MTRMTKSFVYFWESLEDKGEAKERAERVLKPIRKYNEKARKIFELGVGIGAVTANFPEESDIYGLDIEEEYIDVCRRESKEADSL